MVRAKKRLGQHFLKNTQTARRIVDSLTGHGTYRNVLEIGPGLGVLTQHLLTLSSVELWMIDIDPQVVKVLKRKFPGASGRIITGDFLHWDALALGERYAIIGNFPYNISSQIFFRILDHPHRVPEVVCMLQKEVAQRLASPPGNKNYGILSVLLQAHYRIEYLFEVAPEEFTPKPKVISAVIRLRTLGNSSLGCDEIIFRKLVKQGFQKRRKTLRNALKAFNLPPEVVSMPLLDRRAEQLTVGEYISLTNKITPFWNR